MIYEIGRVRVWYTDGEVRFEIIDDHRRLETYLNALNEMPYLLQVLFDIFWHRLTDYLEELGKKRKELDAMVEALEKKIEESKEKYGHEYIEELEKKKKGLIERIEKIKDAITFTDELRKKITSLKVDLIAFKGIVDKIWVGREW